MTELERIIIEKWIDALLVNAENVTYENINYYKITGYSQYIVPKARQITSRILVVAKNMSKFRIVEEMDPTFIRNYTTQHLDPKQESKHLCVLTLTNKIPNLNLIGL